MKIQCRAFGVLLVATLLAPVSGAERVPAIQPDEFDRLHALIQPCPGESPWREIAWVTDVTEARRRSAAENKPLVIFTAADGSPLGRT